MTREEFNALSKKKADADEFEVIERVYMYHPSISQNSAKGKQQIAYLYDEFGMRIIYDMFPASSICMEIENAQRSLDALSRRLKEEMYLT